MTPVMGGKAGRTTEGLRAVVHEAVKYSLEALKTLLGTDVSFDLRGTVRKEEMPALEGDQELVVAEVAFSGDLQGRCFVAVSSVDASKLADLMMGGDGRSTSPEVGPEHREILGELVNQAVGASAVGLSAGHGMSIEHTVHGVSVIPKEMKVGFNAGLDYPVTKVLYGMSLGAAGEASVEIVLDRRLADGLGGLIRPVTPDVGRRDGTVVVRPFDLPEMSEDRRGDEPSKIDILLDVPLQLTVELGRTKRLVKEVLQLGPGSILELDKLAGEAVDVLVNGKLIAKGEVVVIDENFGVRITEIISKADRVRELKA